MLGGAIIGAWSLTQGVVAQSSAEAELIALAKGAVEIQWLLNMLEEVGVKASGTPRLLTDSRAAMGFAKSAVRSKAKHIGLRYHLVKDMVNENKVLIEFVRSEDNAADVLTKSSGAGSFKKALPALMGPHSGTVTK